MATEKTQSDLELKRKELSDLTTKGKCIAQVRKESIQQFDSELSHIEMQAQRVLGVIQYLESIIQG